MRASRGFQTAASLLLAAVAFAPVKASANPTPGPVLSLVSSLQAAPWFSWWWTLGVGARPLGMGGAFTAIADEASAVYWNPAGLSQLVRPEISGFTGSMYLRGPTASGSPGFGFLSVFWPVPKPQVTFGISLMRNIHEYPDEWPYLNNSFFYNTAIIGGSPIKVIFPYVQEDTVALSISAPLTFVKDLSVGLNAKYSTADRMFVEYYRVDGARAMKAYHMDIGFLYKVPLFRFGKELAIGLNAQDAAGGLRFGNGQSVSFPPVVRVGTAYKLNVLRREDTLIAVDWAQAVDARFPGWRNRQVHYGIEQWLLTQTIGFRAGYDHPMGYFGMWSIGMTVRLAGLMFDVAYRHGHPELPPDHLPASTWFTVTYRFGSGPRVPPPIVKAVADPPDFSPHSEETTAIQLTVEHDVPMERWAVTLFDKDEKQVKCFQDKGDPPASVVWAGEDSKFQLLPDGDYTFNFKVRDIEGRIAVTPPGNVRIVSGRMTAPGDPTKLFSLIENQRLAGLGVRDARKGEVKRRFDEHKSLMTTPTVPAGFAWGTNTGPGPWVTPTPIPSPGGAAAGAAVLPKPGAFDYPQIPAGNLLDAYVAVNADNSRTLALDYISNTNDLIFVLRDLVSIAKGMGYEAGPGVANVDIRAHYGDNVLRLNAPLAATRSMALGNTSPEAWLSTSFVSVNGQPIVPSLQ